MIDLAIKRQCEPWVDLKRSIGLLAYHGFISGLGIAGKYFIEINILGLKIRLDTYRLIFGENKGNYISEKSINEKITVTNGALKITDRKIPPIKEKVALADHVIDNNGAWSDTVRQFDELIRELIVR